MQLWGNFLDYKSTAYDPKEKATYRGYKIEKSDDLRQWRQIQVQPSLLQLSRHPHRQV